jgi:hypothetical protein
MKNIYPLFNGSLMLLLAILGSYAICDYIPEAPPLLTPLGIQAYYTYDTATNQYKQTPIKLFFSGSSREETLNNGGYNVYFAKGLTFNEANDLLLSKHAEHITNRDELLADNRGINDQSWSNIIVRREVTGNKLPTIERTQNTEVASDVTYEVSPESLAPPTTVGDSRYYFYEGYDDGGNWVFEPYLYHFSVSVFSEVDKMESNLAGVRQAELEPVPFLVAPNFTMQGTILYHNASSGIEANEAIIQGNEMTITFYSTLPENLYVDGFNVYYSLTGSENELQTQYSTFIQERSSTAPFINPTEAELSHIVWNGSGSIESRFPSVPCPGSKCTDPTGNTAGSVTDWTHNHWRLTRLTLQPGDFRDAGGTPLSDFSTTYPQLIAITAFNKPDEDEKTGGLYSGDLLAESIQSVYVTVIKS